MVSMKRATAGVLLIVVAASCESSPEPAPREERQSNSDPLQLTCPESAIEGVIESAISYGPSPKEAIRSHLEESFSSLKSWEIAEVENNGYILLSDGTVEGRFKVRPSKSEWKLVSSNVCLEWADDPESFGLQGFTNRTIPLSWTPVVSGGGQT